MMIIGYHDNIDNDNDYDYDDNNHIYFPWYTNPT